VKPSGMAFGGLLALSFFALQAGETGTGGRVIRLNERGIPKWDFPADPGENWRFFPLEWQTVPLRPEGIKDFELTAVLRIGEYVFAEAPYDTAHYTRSMSMAQFHFQGGLVLRDRGLWNRYRLQFSVKEKCVALWKTPGNFLAVADCPIEQDRPFSVQVRAVGNRFTVRVDGKPVLEVVDRIAPLLEGRLLAGANHAKVEVGDFAVKPLAEPEEPTPAASHVPAFALRTWCGYRWIFDGAEPIARFGDGKDGKPWSGFPVALMSVKLRPGTLEADTIPLQFRGAGNWPDRPIEVLGISAEKVRLRGHTSDRREDREPTVRTACDVTIEYRADWDSYVYTLENVMTYLGERKPVIEIMDPWPLHVCGPAPSATREWPVRYRDVVWCAAEDGRMYRYPLVHFLSPIIVDLNRERPVFCFHGESDVNPTYEILPPSSERVFKIGLCNVMLDLHVQQREAPKTVAAGTVQRDAWRIYSTHGERLGAFEPETNHHAAWGGQVGHRVAIFDPAGTVFSGDQTVPVLKRRYGQAFTPAAYYALDEQVGHQAPGSLRMEEKNGSRAVMVREGCSYFGADFDGRPCLLRMYVKGENLKGSFQAKAERMPEPKDGTGVFVSAPVTGTTAGWQLVEVPCQPRPGDIALKITLMLKAEKEGTGTVWVDDITLAPTVEE